MPDPESLKVLWGYPNPPGPFDVEVFAQRFLGYLRRAGFKVEGFCLTIDPPAPAVYFPELERRWRQRDPKLLRMYDRLREQVEGYDIFWNCSGLNLHPEFVESIPAFTIFQCSDDPESSERLSKPAAAAYDLALVCNAAEVETYKGWGVRHASFHPLGFHPDEIDPTLSYEKILCQERDIDLFMMSDLNETRRKARLERLRQAFPDGHFFGYGWPRGMLPQSEILRFLPRVRITPNLHLSTGPINRRLYYTPANGIMQICDNKRHLAQVFEPGKEVVGFDTVEECIDLCRYYMAHEQERRQIAADGWQRAVRDYNQAAIWRAALDKANRLMNPTPARPRAERIEMTAARPESAPSPAAVPSPADADLKKELVTSLSSLASQERGDDAVSYALKLLRPWHRVVLDIGAWLGNFCLAAAKINPDSIVYALEPDPNNFRFLANQASGNIFLLRTAVSEQPGIAPLYLSRNTQSHTLFTALDDRSTGQYVPVACVGFETAVSLCGGRVDFMKLNAEGAEIPILSSPAMDRVREAVVEVHLELGEPTALLEKVAQTHDVRILERRPSGRNPDGPDTFMFLHLLCKTEGRRPSSPD